MYNTAINENQALENLATLKETWNFKYPNAVKSWEDNLDNISTFFEFSQNIRKIIYTTNVVESLNSQFRKVTKTKLIIPNDESLLKMLYLATEKVSTKWTRSYSGWDLVINELNIIFEEVLSKSE